MQVVPASFEDIPTYVAFARTAQEWLQARGLRQYVPAAHDEYAACVRSKVEARTLFVVRDRGESIAFFSLEPSPSPWWPPDETAALYLAGMVAAPAARGRGIGSYIVNWCAAQAAHAGRSYVRLDCHADNPRLRRYYEHHGFKLQGILEQHPGYNGCLYELRLNMKH
jgi:GNAT superfamily N-acetyltransferase